MKPTVVICSLILAANTYSFSQNGCSNGRYADTIFSNYTLTSDIPYGQNINLIGNNEILKLDVYEPQGDTLALRPLIIWMHGGGFINGTKADVQSVVAYFAKMGYVAASIDYRLGMTDFPSPGPDSVDFMESILRAVHDAKAAIRFFRNNIVQSGNTYRIDTNLIFFGGSSAGAATTLYLAYMNEISEFPSFIDTLQAGLGGGIEGNSGNPGYSSSVKAIINSAGALADTLFMKTNDVPILSLHGSADNIVPFGTDSFYHGTSYIAVVNGSQSIHIRANNTGTINCLKALWGAGHTPHEDTNAIFAAKHRDTLVRYAANFLLQFVCNEIPICSYIYNSTSVNALSLSKNLRIYPNPAGVSFKIEGASKSEKIHYSLCNLLGAEIKSGDISGNGKSYCGEIQVDGISTGMYFVKVGDGNFSFTKKLNKQ